MKGIILAMLASAMLLLTSCSFNIIISPKEPMVNQPTVQEDATATTEKSEASLETEKDKVEEKETPKVNKNILLDMNSSELREVNIFLSNFSEAYYKISCKDCSDAEQKIDFAFTHILINGSNDSIFYKDMNMGISASEVDGILNRFFGSSVPHATPPNSRDWIYKDDNFLMSAASGEAYPDFSIATQMTERQDGNYDVAFNVYCDHNAYNDGVDKSVYYLTNSKAAEKYEFRYSGNAVLKAKIYNGRDTYELVSYNLE